MSLTDLIPPQYKALAIGIAAVTVIAAAFGAGCITTGWRKDADIAQIKKAQADATLKFEKAARTKESEWNKKWEDAQNEAAKRETALRADADAARQSAIGLRDQLAANKRAMSNAAVETVRQYADSLSDIFSDCTEKYRGMAEEADHHANDVQTLIDSWPK